ncbi:class I SAM-dependent methyltransferase [Microscilla marina]|uniref:Methyltransferase, UbiE/COQ5 family n=1 Tax=Microscilla marina ATCC 23134 TaxID=313606 RepID=A1ZPI6_MICM2|nr:class I SAM-dependent methyltransferase [Microscilla marina]EAY27725.1 methyltransferase, UbiE/COQ5 family [Microscilla marina ATCC 23134]
MKKASTDIYDPQYVKGMFDRMSKTYGTANYLSSFGFTERWRRQCISDLPPIGSQAKGYDLMSGMGEAWGVIQRKVGSQGQIIAVDISDEMNRKAGERLQQLKVKNITLQPLDVLQGELKGNSVDFVVSTFGIKTFNVVQQQRLAQQIAHVLAPGGAFALIEISKPNSWLLKPFYMFYLKVIIPFIGRVFLGNATDYQMLGKYCSDFGDARQFHRFLLEAGLDAHFKTYFFGCATGVFGTKQLSFSS